MPLVRKPSSPAATPMPGDRKLSDLLANGSDDERWSAVRSAPSLPDALPLLSDALSKEHVPRIREAIFTALAKIGSSESAAVALPYIRSDDASARTAAIDALRAMPAAAAGHLPALLTDNDADVRLLACEIARVLPADEASRTLGALIEREDNPNVCAAAVEVLAEAGSTASLPILARCAERFQDDPFLAFAVKIARDRIGSR
jgi:HEAT repeat protein